MRNSSLRKQAYHLMKMNKEGTYKERKRRAFVLDKMIHGLYACQNTPARWQDIETQHIHKLVKCWKKQRIKPTTIMRYMVIIRKIIADLDCHVPYIDNKSLQLTRTKPRKKRIKMDADFWQCLTYPPVRIIMALQMQFGLTFNEAIKIRAPVNIQDRQLTISGDIAFNSMERIIPACAKQQQAILNELNHLIDTDINLIKKYGHSHLRTSWSSELKKYNLPSNKSWRYWYAKRRVVEMLLPEAGHAQACQTIQNEMGIKSRNTLWSYLNH
ncbi:phage integrase N-terminal domain-containing protein [Legionella sp. W10-070]|nr:phage integrase N-terminal domain-containing protein [Legionella sp. W10-070]